MPLRRVVLDPNVYVSAAIASGGTTAAIVDLIDAGVVVPVVSPVLLSELNGVLRRDRFRTWLTHGQVDEFVAELVRVAEVYDDPVDVARVSPDPDDDYLFALAGFAQEDALVSGDADVTGVLGTGLTLLTPRELLDRVTDELDTGGRSG